MAPEKSAVSPGALVAVGDVGVDCYVRDERVARLEGEAVTAPFARPGGCALNLALAARAAGADARVVSVVGDDAAGDRLAHLVAAALSGSVLARRAGPTAVQRIVLARGGERQLCGYEAGVLASWHLDGAQLREIETAAVVAMPLFSQFEATGRAVVAASRRGRLAVDFMDLSDYGGLCGEAAALLAVADVGFFGLATADAAVMTRLVEESRRRDARFVVTLGARGGIAVERGVSREFPAVPVERVVDTTGAGDAFAGAFLATWMARGDLDAAIAAGTAAGARAVARLGAVALRDPSPGSLS